MMFCDISSIRNSEKPGNLYSTIALCFIPKYSCSINFQWHNLPSVVSIFTSNRMKKKINIQFLHVSSKLNFFALNSNYFGNICLYRFISIVTSECWCEKKRPKHIMWTNHVVLGSSQCSAICVYLFRPTQSIEFWKLQIIMLFFCCCNRFLWLLS